MDTKKSPKGRKRTSKGIVIPSGASAMDDHFWDCSVCTFRNNAEAFKCSMCDVRKGTSTRKPRLNPDIVAAQQAQAITPPPLSTTPTPSSSTWSGDEGGPGMPGEEDAESTALASIKFNKKHKDQKAMRKKEPTRRSSSNLIPRLKNVDRNSATYHSVTVNDLTVVITEFKPKVKKEKKVKVNKAGSSQTFDEDSSRTSRSPSESGDGVTSDDNSQPHANGALALDTGGGFL